VLNSLRLWVTVFVANNLGALVFAALATLTGALRPDYRASLVQLGVNSVGIAWVPLFWSGVIGGWIIALVAWMVTASHYTIGQLAVIYLFTLLMGVGHFAHCVASSCEILASVLAGANSVGTYLRWLLPATLGNIAGGVVIVSLLNYGQVAAGEI
jgi:formate/nitrite transporter FocA (FNT family)